MLERADALIAVHCDFPAGLANAKREIGFVPSRRDERFVEESDAIETRPPNQPRSNHRVDFVQRKPVPRRRQFLPADRLDDRTQHASINR